MISDLSSKFLEKYLRLGEKKRRLWLVIVFFRRKRCSYVLCFYCSSPEDFVFEPITNFLLSAIAETPRGNMVSGFSYANHVTEHLITEDSRKIL